MKVGAGISPSPGCLAVVQDGMKTCMLEFDSWNPSGNSHGRTCNAYDRKWERLCISNSVNQKERVWDLQKGNQLTKKNPDLQLKFFWSCANLPAHKMYLDESGPTIPNIVIKWINLPLFPQDGMELVGIDTYPVRWHVCDTTCFVCNWLIIHFVCKCDSYTLHLHVE